MNDIEIGEESMQWGIKTFFFMFLPALILMLMMMIKDRFEPNNESLRAQKWSLLPAILLIVLEISSRFYLTFSWKKAPILKHIEFNLINWKIAGFISAVVLLILIYSLLHYVYKVSIVKTFNIRLTYLPFILRLCGVIALIYLSSIYLFNFDPLTEDQQSKLMKDKSMGTRYLILNAFFSTIIGPIVEEIIFRGLLFVPLYRKVGRHGAIVLSSLAWAYGHFTTLPRSISVFIGGVILAWLYDRRGSLLHPLTLHMFRNSWILVYYF